MACSSSVRNLPVAPPPLPLSLGALPLHGEGVGGRVGGGGGEGGFCTVFAPSVVRFMASPAVHESVASGICLLWLLLSFLVFFFWTAYVYTLFPLDSFGA